MEKMDVPKDWDNPIWREAGRVHEWKNYIDDHVRLIWQSFSDEQKKALAASAESLADAEEWE